MKKAILFLLLATSVGANAQKKQSLKDLLYGGKLKLDSNAVIRKDDDLAAKIDTATRKPEPQRPTVVEANPVPANTTATASPKTENPVATTEGNTETGTENATAEAAPKPAAPKSNTKIWKEYTDALIANLTSGVLKDKKIKKETYFVIVEYELGETGTVNVLNITSSPENALLQSEIKTQLDNNPPPQLQPVLGSDGKGRKVKRKQSFSVTKE